MAKMNLGRGRHIDEKHEIHQKRRDIFKSERP